MIHHNPFINQATTEPSPEPVQAEIPEQRKIQDKPDLLLNANYSLKLSQHLWRVTAVSFPLDLLIFATAENLQPIKGHIAYDKLTTILLAGAFILTLTPTSKVLSRCLLLYRNISLMSYWGKPLLVVASVGSMGTLIKFMPDLAIPVLIIITTTISVVQSLLALVFPTSDTTPSVQVTNRFIMDATGIITSRLVATGAALTVAVDAAPIWYYLSTTFGAGLLLDCFFPRKSRYLKSCRCCGQSTLPEDINSRGMCPKCYNETPQRPPTRPGKPARANLSTPMTWANKLKIVK